MMSLLLSQPAAALAWLAVLALAASNIRLLLQRSAARGEAGAAEVARAETEKKLAAAERDRDTAIAQADAFRDQKAKLEITANAALAESSTLRARLLAQAGPGEVRDALQAELGGGT
jgi:hypothetical protein